MTCYMIPALFFLLPSLTHPGAFEKVSINSLPHTKLELETSKKEEFVRFREHWYKTSHKVCKENHGIGYCAKSVMVTPTDVLAECVHLPLR